MSRILPAALFGLLLGLGLGLWSNTSGVVLAFYGLAVAVVAALLVSAAGRRSGRS